MVGALILISYLVAAFVGPELLFEIFAVGASPLVCSVVMFWRAVSETVGGSSLVVKAMPLDAWAGGCVKCLEGEIFEIACKPKMIPDYIGQHLFTFMFETRRFQGNVPFTCLL